MTDGSNTGGSFLKNVQVLDQDAADALCQRLVKSLGEAEKMIATINQSLEQGKSLITKAPEACSQLQLQVKSGQDIASSLKDDLNNAAKLIDDLNSRQKQIEQAAAQSTASFTKHTEQLNTAANEIHEKLNASASKLMSDLQSQQEKITSLAGQIDQDIEAMVQKAESRFNERVSETIKRAEDLANMLDGAEGDMAARALRSALSGGLPPQVVHVPVGGGASSELVTELESKIAELTEKCETLQREQELASSQRDLVSGLYNDLETGLGDLNKTAEELEHTALDNQQRGFLESATASVTTLKQLVQGMSSIALGKEDADALEAGDFNLHAAIGDAVKTLAARARSRGVNLTFDTHKDTPVMVRGERGRLRLILFSVVNSAIKLAGRDGEITIRVSVDKDDAEKTITRFSVIHFGSSIPKDRIDSLLKATPPTEGKAESSHDAGLCIAKQLIEAADGQIGVESDGKDHFNIWFTITWQKIVARDDKRRTSNRLSVEYVKSNLGPVQDLSKTGARLISSQELTGQVDIRIWDAENSVELEAEVMRCQHQGWRKYDVGLRFLHVSPAVGEKITRISMQNRMRRTVGDNVEEPVD